MRSRHIVGCLCILLVGLACPRVIAQDALKQIRSKDVDDRLAAILELRSMDPDVAERPLLGALKDKDWEVVERAAEALGQAGGKKAADALADLCLEGPTARLRETAIRALAKLGAGPAAEQWAKDARGREPLRAVLALAVLAQEAPDDTVRTALDKALESGTVEVRVAAARGLAAFPAAEQAARLTALLKAEVEVACAALDAVRDQPEKEHGAVLLARLQEGTAGDVLERRLRRAYRSLAAASTPADREGLARAACAAWSGQRPVPAVAALIRLVADLGMPRAGDQGLPEDDLLARGPLVQALLPHLQQPSPEVRAAATQALAFLGTKEALDAIQERVTKDEHPRVRDGALRALLRQRTTAHEPTVDLLIDRLRNDPEPRVREDAAVALGRFGLTRAVAPLIEGLGDPDWGVVVCAAVSLGKIKDAEAALGPLAALWEDKDWRKAGGALVGLGHLKTHEAVPFLIDALGSKHETLRRTAYAFLQRMTVKGMPMKRPTWAAWWEEEKDGYVFVDGAEKIRNAQKYGYAPTPVGVYEDLDVLVFESRGDHIEQLLTNLGVQHRMTRMGQVEEAGVQPFGLYVANCTGECQVEDLGQVAWFVRAGGYLFASCWALEHHVQAVYPGVMRRLPTHDQVLDNVVAEPAAEGSPFLRGVFGGGSRPVYRLEGAYLIEVLDRERVEVLIDSPQAATRWGGGNLAGWFPAGHGVILDSVNHFDLQGLERIEGLKTGTDRMAWAVDHMGVDFEELRRLDEKHVWNNASKAAEAVRDLSAFRFITNFVRQKRVDED